MERTTLTGTPYLTQVELKDGEDRQLYCQVYTVFPDEYRDATEDEIAEVQAREDEEE